MGRGDAFAQEEARERKKDAAVDDEYVEAGRRVRRGKSAQRTSAGVQTENVGVRSTTRPATRASADVG